MSETALYLDTREFRREANRFVRETGKDLSVVYKDIMRVLVETLYHWTPPPTKGNRGSRGGRAGGKAIINQDVNWIVDDKPMSWMNILYERFGGETGAGQEWRTKSGRIWLIDSIKLNRAGNLNTVDQWHKSKRKSRGRVFTHKGDETEDIGRWKSRDKMFVPKGTTKRYIRDVHKRVGKLKDAWANALHATGSKLPLAWVRKAGGMPGHYGTPSGGYKDAINNQEWKGYLEATAKAAYMRDSDRFVARAHDYVQRNIMQKRLERWMEQAIQRHNKVK